MAINENCIHEKVCGYSGYACADCNKCILFEDVNQYYKLPAPIGTTAYLVRRMRDDVDGYGMWFEYYWGVEQVSFSIKHLELVGKSLFFDATEAEKARKEQENRAKLS